MKYYNGGHIKVAEKALERELRGTEEVHHVDGDIHNNIGGNLVICPNHTYHMLLHKRAAAFDACGNPNYRVCTRCKMWDALEKLERTLTGYGHEYFQHTACRRKYIREYMRKFRAKRKSQS